jgi:hypothetical protein
MNQYQHGVRATVTAELLALADGYGKHNTNTISVAAQRLAAAIRDHGAAAPLDVHGVCAVKEKLRMAAARLPATRRGSYGDFVAGSMAGHLLRLGDLYGAPLLSDPEYFTLVRRTA